MLKLMYITNDPKVAEIVQSAGVDRVFVDMEYIDKAKRQGGMDTVQSHHTIEDVRNVRQVLTTTELMVRINHWHEASSDYCSSKQEIEETIEAGADVLMLPYFKTVSEVKKFLDAVDGRVKTMLLLETAEAEKCLDEILTLRPDEVHIGINDLCISKHKKFMFEMYEDGTVEEIVNKCHDANIPVGIGGIGAIGKGTIPGNLVIREQYRLGSSFAILSRSFCNTNKLTDYGKINVLFQQGVKAVRDFENQCQVEIEANNQQVFIDNKEAMDNLIKQVAMKMK